MRLSIRTRMLLATNLLVAGIGVVVGWVGIEVAGREIERRLVDEAVVKAAQLIHQTNLPRASDDLLVRIGGILGAKAASGPADFPEIAAGGLSTGERRELSGQLSGGQLPLRVVLGNQGYRLGSSLMPAQAGRPDQRAMRLYLLVPENRIIEAKKGVARTIVLLTLAAVAVATLVAVWISQTITRPVRQLARQMDRLSKAAADVDLNALLASQEHSARRGPVEIVRLAASYDELMAQLTEARAKLAQSTRMATLGQFSATMAHELRNPLSGIKMNARVLADELRRVNVSDMSLDLILREIDRMDLHLQELLSLAVEGGQPAGSQQDEDAGRRAVRLDELAHSVVSLLAGRCEQASIGIECEFPPEALGVRAQGERIRQVILNLMLNAIEAMPSGGTVRLSAATRPERRVRFSVADTGGGVHVPEGVDIFEPFATGKAGGTGLGLHVCRKIVEQHGGTIGYESSDHGSTFWFDLPGAQ